VYPALGRALAGGLCAHRCQTPRCGPRWWVAPPLPASAARVVLRHCVPLLVLLVQQPPQVRGYCAKAGWPRVPLWPQLQRLP
jgi:hypothetical protein